MRMSQQTYSSKGIGLLLALFWLFTAQVGLAQDSKVNDVPNLANQLQSTKVEIRRAAVHDLGKIGEAAEIPLIEALEDSDEFVRDMAISALKDIGSEAAITALIEALKEDSNGLVSEALWRISENSTPLLIEALSHQYKKDESMQLEIIYLLRMIGGKRVVESLINRLKEGEVSYHLRYSIHQAVIENLEFLDTSDIKEILEDADKDLISMRIKKGRFCREILRMYRAKSKIHMSDRIYYNMRSLDYHCESNRQSDSREIVIFASKLEILGGEPLICKIKSIKEIWPKCQLKK